MKDKIVKFFNNIKNHALKLLTRIKGHFIKHKQRYMRVLLVILCVYLVLLALCSIGRCTRKNVITADALGENTDTYFEIPVVMPSNNAFWVTASSASVSYQMHSCVLSTPLYIRMSRNLDFLGVSSISQNLVEKFVPVDTSTHFTYKGFVCSSNDTYITSSGIIGSVSQSPLGYTVNIDYVDRTYGSYPSITQCNVIPIDNAGQNFFSALRVELVNLTDDVSTLICAFEITASVETHPFDFIGYNVSYDVSISDTYASGYAAGRQAGYNDGYSRGYANGSQTVGDENQFTALMNAIVFVPINALWNVLNFDILGVNVFMFVTAVITVLVVAWLWGKMK